MKLSTVDKIGSGLYKKRGSKFYSFLHPIISLDQHRHLISIYKTQYIESCHVCSAYRLDVNSRIDEQGIDDGEPKGSAGKPILNQIQSNDLINVGIYVVRIYGGVLLGIPGLIESYSNAALLCIDNTHKIEWSRSKNVSFSFSYNYQRHVDSMINEKYIKVNSKIFSDQIFIDLKINEDKIDEFCKEITKISSGKIKPAID